MVRNAFHRIWERMHTEKKDMDINLGHIAVKIEQDLTNESDTPMAKNNPFQEHFTNMINKLEKQISNAKDGDNKNVNRSYCHQFFRFIERQLPEMPLWSGVSLGSLDRYKTAKIVVKMIQIIIPFYHSHQR